MGLARDYQRATILRRREQEKRNREAAAAEEARVAGLPDGHYRVKPPQPMPRDTRASVKMVGDYVQENKMLTQQAPENKVAPPQPEEAAPVPFASPAAARLAEEWGLMPGSFQGETPTGKTGFTAADVRAIAEGVSRE